ncbi:spermatogenesis associated 2-like isoform X1 [Tachysurus fulvidraco]|uniref:spermatogenesis associated 2-like isoform X1 n=1 Tax=Tachysurus fulvidraco TaxID=1234273 RepID=UPI001FEF6322|nr:spermatogenesis associated 2-like isoform X1 [Tachysurus fulvidraco]XP_027017719.2 spermatogenesis associated 2-like isoform X1 [Tachysurus fulvidraco]
MSSGNLKNGIGYLEDYKANLERRLQQGDWDLVCKDEELCKEVETSLSECSSQGIHPQLGLDTLAVIETSLRASHHTHSQNRLKSLVKAFEVLELAALNLYLCPWRKEYKVVKMFSGMFTHCVKPALTAQQAKELFALLGYHPGGSNVEELRLTAKPVHSHTLIQLAWAFFTARIECQLLLTAVHTLGDRMECVLQLIHERKLGCTFQVALDSAKRKLEPDPALDAALDLYTDNNLAEHGHMASPPSLPYIPPIEDFLTNKMFHSSISQSNLIQRNEKKSQNVSISSLTHHINATQQKTGLSLNMCENEKQFMPTHYAQLCASKEGQIVCNCLTSCDLHHNQCLQCREVHSMDCPCLRSCKEKGHEVIFAQEHMMNVLSLTGRGQIQSWEKPPKDNLKQHSCTNKTSNDIYFVCHDCHYIHDENCEELKRCFQITHNVQRTGRLQPAQVERQVIPHTCLKVEGTDYVLCHTCNKSHDYLCDELQICKVSSHNVIYMLENNEKPAQAMPMPLHNCCASTQPEFACHTCRVFHGVSCDANQCQRHHNVQSLKHVCCTCSDTNLFILCRYCCAQHCKNCWFKNPLECKCGKPFEFSAV